MTEADPKIIIQVPTLPTKGKRGPQADGEFRYMEENYSGKNQIQFMITCVLQSYTHHRTFIINLNNINVTSRQP